MDRGTASLIGSLILGREWHWPDAWIEPKDPIQVIVMVLGSAEGRAKLTGLIDLALRLYQR